MIIIIKSNAGNAVSRPLQISANIGFQNSQLTEKLVGMVLKLVKKIIRRSSS
jgi:hypothetical protein